jgi:epoxyqueuosine reductase
LAVGLGNALRQSQTKEHAELIQAALETRSQHPSEIVREHVAWALQQAPKFV